MMYLVENIEALYDESSVNSKPSLRVISLEKLCYDVADIVSCLMDGRVRVTFRGPNDPMCCSLDRDKIERMLLNIVCNSLRNIEMGTGRLDIRLSKERDMAVIAIKDNGSGIPEEKKHDIFDMRVKARRLDDAKAGLGLGLPIAARLAAQHRGKVSVESGADGTTVKVYIPMIIDNILPFRSPDPVDYMNMRRVLTSLSSAMPADCYKKKYGD
jgi:two-component system OmpR family sensor kinase